LYFHVLSPPPFHQGRQLIDDGGMLVSQIVLID